MLYFYVSVRVHTVQETFTLPIPFPDWSDDSGAHDQDRKEQLERRYQAIINDAPGHQSFESSSFCSLLIYCLKTLKEDDKHDRAEFRHLIS